MALASYLSSSRVILSWRVQRQFPVPDAAACETAEQTLRMLGLPVTSGRAQKKEDKK